MAPIPLRQSNSTVSSARVPNGTHGTARISTGIRAANNDPGWNTSLASPPLIATLAVLGLLSLTIFSIFGRRLLQADRRRRRSHGQGMDSETSGTADNHYLLADFLGLNLGHMRRRMSQPSVLDIPKIWDIQCQGGAPGLESYKGHLSSWGDIMVSLCAVGLEGGCRVRPPLAGAPNPRTFHSLDVSKLILALILFDADICLSDSLSLRWCLRKKDVLSGIQRRLRPFPVQINGRVIYCPSEKLKKRCRMSSEMVRRDLGCLRVGISRWLWRLRCLVVRGGIRMCI